MSSVGPYDRTCEDTLSCQCLPYVYVWSLACLFTRRARSERAYLRPYVSRREVLGCSCQHVGQDSVVSCRVVYNTVLCVTEGQSLPISLGRDRFSRVRLRCHGLGLIHRAANEMGTVASMQWFSCGTYGVYMPTVAEEVVRR